MYNFEQIGFIPRSIVRTLKRFIKQISLKTDLFVIYEFRISRYIAIASIQCFFFLIICPWIFQILMKFLLINVFFQYRTISKVIPRDIFINFHQQERAFSQIQTFSQKVYFETLFESFKQTSLRVLNTLPLSSNTTQSPRAISRGAPKAKEWMSPAPSLRTLGQPNKGSGPGRPFHRLLAFDNLGYPTAAEQIPNLNPIYEIYQTYFLKCAYFYNQQSISIIINWILDLTTLLFFLFLLIFSTPQVLILKTFFTESLLSLSETTKCFFLIFFLDLLVGFHSSKSWEIFLQFLIEHFGFQIHQNFIFFFISTFPVLLDTIFKYWIFRYLNKISPSTVATYQAMIE